MKAIIAILVLSIIPICAARAEEKKEEPCECSKEVTCAFSEEGCCVKYSWLHPAEDIWIDIFSPHFVAGGAPNSNGVYAELGYQLSVFFWPVPLEIGLLPQYVHHQSDMFNLELAFSVNIPFLLRASGTGGWVSSEGGGYSVGGKLDLVILAIRVKYIKTEYGGGRTMVGGGISF